MNPRRLAWASFSLVAFACSQSATLPNSPLTGAVTATEVTESGETLEIPREGITEVDINSSVILKVNAAPIKQAAANANQLDPVEAEQLGTQIKELEALLSKQKQAVETLTAWASREVVAADELMK